MDEDQVYISIEWPDGTIARWARSDDDDRIDIVSNAIEHIIGPPDTLTL